MSLLCALWEFLVEKTEEIQNELGSIIPPNG